jgi:CheY-like chemotaxis protein
MAGKRIGEIFVEHGILTAKTVDRALARSRSLNRRLGEVLELMELITGEELAAALAIQNGCKVVKNLKAIPVNKEVLKLVSVGVAMQNFILPLGLEGGRLAMAMADPSPSTVIDNIAEQNGCTVVPFAACKRDILSGICFHYLGKEPQIPTERTVLVVEDDNLALAMFAKILEAQGYRVVTAGDGLEAFRLVIAEKPHVIVTDKELPKMDGYGLFDALSNVPDTCFIPVILVTGAAMSPEEEARAFDRGFFDYIPKPVNPVTLTSRVKRGFQFYDHQYRLS